MLFHSDFKLQGSGHTGRLLSELNRCRLSRLLCDVVLQVGGRSFPAHRVVLACSCTHFNSLFSRGSGNQGAVPTTFSLDFVSAANFEKVLTFIYTGEIFTDLIDVGVLYELAERLGVRELVNACHATFPDLQSSSSGDAVAEGDLESDLVKSTFGPQEPCSVPDSSAQLGGETCAPSSSSNDPLDSLQLGAVAGPIKDSDFFEEDDSRKRHRLQEEQTEGSDQWRGLSEDIIELSDEEEHFIVDQLLEYSSPSSSPMEASGSGKAGYNLSLGFSMQDKMAHGGALFPAGLVLNGNSGGGREKLYRCRYCGKHFAHSGEFTYHLRIHTGEKPYQCKVCMRFFRGRSTMICHLKTHSGALMYRCTVCGLFFSTLKMVSSHMELHKDQLPPDFNIEETFMYNDHSKEPVPNMDT
uniref:Zinc finger and BTB domain containing 39 n=1 Tax=Sinocyclocheilus anshuiensis TaxID=1608454 RepID=A0A671N9P7_9TELE